MKGNNTMTKFNKQEKKAYDFLLENEDVDIATILDVVIKSNGLIGVGLISLQKGIEQHIKTYMPKEKSLDKIMN